MLRSICAALLVASGGAGSWSWAQTAPLKAAEAPSAAERLSILYPIDGTLFPADIRSPEIRWEDVPKHKVWLLRFSFRDPKRDFQVFVESKQWAPARMDWEKIKRSSRETPATLEISGFESRGAPAGGRAHIAFSTSKDAVGAPIFFRAVPTPFPDDKDFVKVKWKLGRASSYDPPITVMQKQARCFNCHAASLDGKSFGFEFNLLHAKPGGMYMTFREPGKKVVFDRRKNGFDWNEYIEDKTQRSRYQGFMSAISPDGSVYVTSGKARTGVDFKDIRDAINFTMISKGILLYYSVKDRVIKALPGADDEHYSQLPGSWSPDGKFIYFFRGAITPQFEELNREAMDDKLKKEQAKLGWRDLDKIYDFKFDVYRIPFNGGKGGRASPVAGAAGNGKSNFFPRISPDGKWLVFTQSANAMTIGREDSDLYIIPAYGGKARRLMANGPRGDSWHSWSPNSRWLAFASKSYGAQTNIVLTHIDEHGKDSPAVILSQMREDGLVANLPEFFNIKPGQLEEIDASQVDD